MSEPSKPAQYPARDRLFALIASIPGSGAANWCDHARVHLDDYRAEVLAERAVSSSAPADRAALEGARGIARRLAAHAVGFQDVLDDTDRGPWAKTVGADITALCTALDELTVPAPPVDLAAAPNPTPLRWGLNDVLWGDDDTVTVLLSGPAGEPYWLELDPERAGVLREDLAGPDGETTADKVVAAMHVPCSFPPCDTRPGEPCDTHERLWAHAEGDHELCGPDCPAAPSDVDARQDAQ
jgi:hypothetical protein